MQNKLQTQQTEKDVQSQLSFRNDKFSKNNATTEAPYFQLSDQNRSFDNAKLNDLVGEIKDLRNKIKHHED